MRRISAQPWRVVSLGLAVAAFGLVPAVAVAASADLSVHVTAPASSRAGSTVTFSVTVTNSGPNAAQAVVVTAAVPAGTTYFASGDAGSTHFTDGTTPGFGSATGTVTGHVPSLPVGASVSATASLTFEVNPATPVGTVITLTASASSSTSDPVSGNNTGSASTTVSAALAGTADLAVGVTAPPSAQPGTDITYAVTVTNSGPNTAQSVALSSTVPAGTTYGGASFISGQEPDGGTAPSGGGTGAVVVAYTSLASGATSSFSVRVRVADGASSGTVVSYVTTAFSSTSDPTPGNNAKTVTTTISVPLAITTTSPLPTGMVGAAYSVQFAATGGTGGYTWIMTHGTAGKPSLSAGGLLAGTPDASGDFSFGVRVTDSASSAAEGTFSLHVDPAAPYAYDIWVPVASHNGGQNQSQWRSDLGLLNTGGVTAHVEFKFFGSAVVSDTTSVPAKMQLILTDVVGQIGGSNSGAIEILSDQPLKVTARSYNLVSSAASCYPNGTQGQNYPALAPSDGLSDQQVAYLAGLTENGSYRCNIGLVNLGLTSASVLVELFDGAGVKLTDYPVTLAAGQWVQETQPFRNKAAQTAMDRGYAKITVQTGSGVFAVASVINNVTNDPTTVTMQR